ncbi:MAG: YfcE family phosphodiesterase [Caldilineaceae bacterium]|nr:YfcE family phosphodiesterase [Caldilineaceae bacterium]
MRRLALPVSPFLPPTLAPERVVGCIGLIADTHLPQRLAALPPAIETVFLGVDLILHAGDVGRLTVLDQLSVIAPVIAVHGNDDTPEAQRELPYQQVITCHGQRLLLWHSHFPDRVDELYSRMHDEFTPQLDRSLARARRCGARIVVFGHWHIPFVYQTADVMVINPGALASGNPFTRQLCQTVALLFWRDDGVPFVSHVDLAQPDRIYTPTPDWAASFSAAAAPFTGSILAPELEVNLPYLREQFMRFGFEEALRPWLCVAHRCWAGEQAVITLAELRIAVRTDPEFSPARKAEYEAILSNLPTPSAATGGD